MLPTAVSMHLYVRSWLWPHVLAVSRLYQHGDHLYFCSILYPQHLAHAWLVTDTQLIPTKQMNRHQRQAEPECIYVQPYCWDSKAVLVPTPCPSGRLLFLIFFSRFKDIHHDSTEFLCFVFCPMSGALLSATQWDLSGSCKEMKIEKILRVFFFQGDPAWGPTAQATKMATAQRNVKDVCSFSCSHSCCCWADYPALPGSTTSLTPRSAGSHLLSL